MFHRKSRLLAAALCAMLAAVLIIPVSAHGCHGGGRRGHHSQRQWVQTQVTVCAYEDCAVAGRHLHNGVIYCGYAHAGGLCDNSCRALCALEGCDQAGRHLHGGVTYCGYDHEAGFCDGTCRALCGRENCHQAGRHLHNGVAYCGYHHEAGFCDGSCALTAAHGCHR